MLDNFVFVFYDNINIAPISWEPRTYDIIIRYFLSTVVSTFKVLLTFYRTWVFIDIGRISHERYPIVNNCQENLGSDKS